MKTLMSARAGLPFQFKVRLIVLGVFGGRAGPDEVTNEALFAVGTAPGQRVEGARSRGDTTDRVTGQGVDTAALAVRRIDVRYRCRVKG